MGATAAVGRAACLQCRLVFEAQKLVGDPHVNGLARMRPRQLWDDSTAQQQRARAEPIQTRNLKLLHAVLAKRQPHKHHAAAAMDTAVTTMRP